MQLRKQIQVLLEVTVNDVQTNPTMIQQKLENVHTKLLFLNITNKQSIVFFTFVGQILVRENPKESKYKPNTCYTEFLYQMSVHIFMSNINNIYENTNVATHFKKIHTMVGFDDESIKQCRTFRFKVDKRRLSTLAPSLCNITFQPAYYNIFHTCI